MTKCNDGLTKKHEKDEKRLACPAHYHHTIHYAHSRLCF